jgi:hypothetical protein
MSLASVDRALAEFVHAAEPRILALTGDWGRGKTFYWRSFLSGHSEDDHRASHYAYVSLFGLKDLRDVQDSLVAGAVPIRDVSANEGMPVKRSFIERASEWPERARAKIERKARSYSDLADKLPKLGQFGPLARAMAFRIVKDYLVCIDDVERRSESLPLRDVLGMASMLREQRGCRVLIILNSDALSVADRETFHTLREKVFDSEIVFEPSAAECAVIAFPGGSRLYERAAENAIRLGITNIRVLYRIRRLIDTISPQAMAENDDIQTQIIHSSVLLGWCFNSGGGRAPLFSYVKGLNFSSFIDLDKSKERPAHEKAWNQLLSDYGYSNTDELDAAICDVLERGYVNTERLNAVISNRTEAVRRARLERAFEEAWGLYHGSFDPSPHQLVAAFESSVKASATTISSVNLSATTMLLRSLGYDSLADELMNHWINVNSETQPAALNIQASDWKEEVRDLRFRAAAQSAFDRLPNMARPFGETALALSQQNGWSEDDIRVLARASTDEYYGLLTSLSYPQTGRVVRALLRFGQFDESQPEYSKIAGATRAALMRIGRESALNRQRVKSYGIDPEATDREHPNLENGKNPDVQEPQPAG